MFCKVFVKIAIYLFVLLFFFFQYENKPLLSPVTLPWIFIIITISEIWSDKKVVFGGSGLIRGDYRKNKFESFVLSL
jgi:hypothetical protein